MTQRLKLLLCIYQDWGSDPHKSRAGAAAALILTPGGEMRPLASPGFIERPCPASVHKGVKLTTTPSVSLRPPQAHDTYAHTHADA